MTDAVDEYQDNPDPCFNTILVKVCLPKEEKTAGGLILTTQSIEKESLAETTGYIEAIGPLAFSTHKGANGEVPEKLQVGDKILFTRYAGRLTKEWSEVKTGIVEYRIMRDSDVIGVYRKKTK